jgi:hypothetical protein
VYYSGLDLHPSTITCNSCTRLAVHLGDATRLAAVSELHDRCNMLCSTT